MKEIYHYPKICVYAICKNESKFVDRWVNSLKEADCIVVMDTGSTDNTVELLQKYSPFVTVKQKIIDPWRFDTARNESMKMIPEDADICVVSDFDQVFRPGWADELRELYMQGYHEVYGPIIDYDEENNEEKRFLSKNVHPNDKAWYWERPIHEGVNYHGEDKINSIVSENFVIEHHPDKSKSRGSYLELLEKEYEENSTDLLCAIYYSCELYFHKRIDDALEVMHKSLTTCDFSNTDPTYAYIMFLNIANLYKEKKENKIALDYLNKSETFGIYTRKLYMAFATSYSALGDHRTSIYYIQKAFSIKENVQSWIEEDMYFNGACYDELSMQYYYLGEYSLALLFADLALSHPNLPDKERVENNKSYFIDEFVKNITNVTKNHEDNLGCYNVDDFYYLIDYELMKISSRFDIYNSSKLNYANIIDLSRLIDKIENSPKRFWNRKRNLTLIDYIKKLMSDRKEDKIFVNTCKLLIIGLYRSLLHIQKCYYPEYDDELLYNDTKVYEMIADFCDGVELPVHALIYSIIVDHFEDINDEKYRALNKTKERRVALLSLFDNDEYDFIKTIDERHTSYYIQTTEEKDKILNTVDERENEKMKVDNKICVYAICKNESQFVDIWVESMKEADLIVVLDTGSTDNTVDKLKAHIGREDVNIIIQQKIINPWRFDTARNEALNLVPPEYNILVSTDLDEILEHGWASHVRDNWIEGVHERAIYKYSWSHLSNGDSGRVFQYDKIHSRKWIWKYPVHELLWNTEIQTNLYNNENILYLFDTVHLHHFPDHTKSRSSYLPLLELRAQEDKEDYYGLIYLAHEYYYQGYYEKSIETLNYILSNFKDKYSTVEQASCYLFMGDSYNSLKENEKAMDSYLKAIYIDPSYREPYLNLAKVLIEEKKYSIAQFYIRECLMKTYRHFTWVERDTSWTYEPYDLMCLALWYNGDKKESLVYAVKAYSFDPTDERLKKNVNDVLLSLSDEELAE